MNKITNYINGNISKQSKRYVKGLEHRSRYFDKGNKKCKTTRDKQTMLMRDIATIDKDTVNKRQQDLKVNLIMILGFYIMVIYFLVNTII